MNSRQDPTPAADESASTEIPEHARREQAGQPAPISTTLPDGRVADVESSGATADTFVQDTASMALVSEESSPIELVSWGLKRFQDQKMIMTTSFGMEGCALIDMCSKAIEQNDLPGLQVAWIDTGFFFPETHQLRKKLEDRYKNIEIVRWATDVSVDQQAETYGNELWKNTPTCAVTSVKLFR